MDVWKEPVRLDNLLCSHLKMHRIAAFLLHHTIIVWTMIRCQSISVHFHLLHLKQDHSRPGSFHLELTDSIERPQIISTVNFKLTQSI